MTLEYAVQKWVLSLFILPYSILIVLSSNLIFTEPEPLWVCKQAINPKVLADAGRPSMCAVNGITTIVYMQQY